MTEYTKERIHTETTHEKPETNGLKSILAAFILLLLLSNLLFGGKAGAEDYDSEEDWYSGLTVMEDPAFFMTDEELRAVFPVITSVGKKNVKVNGIKSKNKLTQYTIPEELLRADDTFLALMMEAEKYIGYPYVYGESNPKRGFDCSGFVCWVFIESGVYSTKRLGANGLHSRCTEVDEESIRPGDFVFFDGTMGRDVEVITHVGIYVGNHMMIHAGDPVGLLFLPVCFALAEEGTFPDTDTPVMTAEIDGDIATDASSGIAGVQVNGLLYTKLDNDRLTISLSGTLGSYEQLAIRAFDYEGNFTEPIHLEKEFPFYPHRIMLF